MQNTRRTKKHTGIIMSWVYKKMIGQCENSFMNHPVQFCRIAWNAKHHAELTGKKTARQQAT